MPHYRLAGFTRPLRVGHFRRFILCQVLASQSAERLIAAEYNGGCVTDTALKAAHFGKPFFRKDGSRSPR
jgi:hypothetical protein